MIRLPFAASVVAAALLISAVAPAARAHFPWLATDDEGRALLFFGESPSERKYHTPEAVAAAKVVQRTAGAEPADIALTTVESDDFVGRRAEAAVPKGAVLESTISYGVYHGMLLDYFAKHVTSLDGEQPKSGLKLDAIPRTTGKGLQLVVQWDGQPLAKAAVTMIDGKGGMTEGETDAEGVATFEAPAPGLIGFLVNRTDNEARGEVAGEKYTSHGAYGTVTVQFSQPTTTGMLPPLPEPVASFGAAVSDDWLYVYGGHTGEEHAHSAENLSQHFRRVRLAGGAWEELPMQTPLQGLPLVAYEGKLYRVGGLNFRNPAGGDEDMHSVAEFACFDPATKQWTALAPLPEERSSHDAVVIGSTLYVVGGWKLAGDSKGTWLDTAWSFDLTDPAGAWRVVVSPPFKRRALAVAEWNGKLVALGGMDENAKVSRRVDALDLASRQWAELPKLPRSQMAGFGVSAWNLAGKLLVSGADGDVHQLADDGSKWETVGQLATGRFFHRLMPGVESTLLAVAGASMDDGHLATIETFSPAPKN